MSRQAENLQGEPELLYQPRIMLSGITGGTGASTTAKELRKLTELPIISGGKHFRGLAREFSLYQEEHPDQLLTQQYAFFLLFYEQLFREQGLPGVAKYINESVQVGANGELLDRFEAAIAQYNGNVERTASLWDYIVDQSTLKEALELPGFIWESKLAVLAMHLDQMKSVIADKSVLAFPSLSVLLTLDPEIASHRISEREKRPVSVEEVEIRKMRDFKRYEQLYSIDGTPVRHEDLARFVNSTINTQDLLPNQVAATILRDYMKLITTTNQHPLYAYPLIQNLESALARSSDESLTTI